MAGMLAAMAGPRMTAADIMGGAPMTAPAMSFAPGAAATIAGAGQQVRSNFFGEGGPGRAIVGSIGDALLAMGGHQGFYGPAMQAHAAFMQDQQEAQLDADLKRRQIALLDRKATQPNVEHVGDALGILDPDTGGFTPTYTAPTEAERYAMAIGAERGTPQWMTALQDFTLRGRGPTSSGFADDLEDTRQDNRVALERMRQSGRLSLRSVPTYGQAHPRIVGSPNVGGYPGGRNSPMPQVSTADLLRQLGG